MAQCKYVTTSQFSDMTVCCMLDENHDGAHQDAFQTTPHVPPDSVWRYDPSVTSWL